MGLIHIHPGGGCQAIIRSEGSELVGAEVHQYLCPNPANVQFMLPSGTIKQLCLDCSARWSQRWSGQLEAEQEERMDMSEKGVPMSKLERALADSSGERTGYVLREELEKLRALQAETAKFLRLPEVPESDPPPKDTAPTAGMVAALDSLGFYLREQAALAGRILSAIQAIDHRLS